MLNDEEGLIPKLVTKCGSDAPQLVREIDRILSQMPSVTGNGAGEVYLSQDCSLMLSQAEKDAKKQGDDFVSVEHIFAAILDNPTPALKAVFAKCKLTKRVLWTRFRKLKPRK